MFCFGLSVYIPFLSGISKGVGRIIADCQKAPLVLPIWHIGKEMLLYLYYIPSVDVGFYKHLSARMHHARAVYMDPPA